MDGGMSLPPTAAAYFKFRSTPCLQSVYPLSVRVFSASKGRKLLKIVIDGLSKEGAVNFQLVLRGAHLANAECNYGPFSFPIISLGIY